MARQSDSDSPVPSGWNRCPPGEVRRLAEKLRLRQRRRLFLRRTAVAAAAVFGLAAGGTGWWLWRRSDRPPPQHEYDYGGITCSEVRRLAEPYRNGTLAEPQRSQVRRQIELCPACGPAFRRPGETPKAAARPSARPTPMIGNPSRSTIFSIAAG